MHSPIYVFRIYLFTNKYDNFQKSNCWHAQMFQRKCAQGVGGVRPNPTGWALNAPSDPARIESTWCYKINIFRSNLTIQSLAASCSCDFSWLYVDLECAICTRHLQHKSWIVILLGVQLMNDLQQFNSNSCSCSVSNRLPSNAVVIFPPNYRHFWCNTHSRRQNTLSLGLFVILLGDWTGL